MDSHARLLYNHEKFRYGSEAEECELELTRMT